MTYVYILESLDSEHFYIGITEDLRARLAKHNAGEVPHTSKYKPWRLKIYVAFSDEKQALIPEVCIRPGICEETSLMLNAFVLLTDFARNAHDD
jgi:predicted GIY-YIG superfamily endonuclease